MVAMPLLLVLTWGDNSPAANLCCITHKFCLQAAKFDSFFAQHEPYGLVSPPLTNI